MKTNVQKTGFPVFMASFIVFFIIILVSCTDEKRKIPDTPYTRDMNARKHRISKDRALSMLRTYDRNRDSLLRGGFSGDTLMMPIAETFNLSAIDSLLTQPGLAALRTYVAMDPITRKMKIILVGVNKDGKDILQDGRSGAMKFGGGDASLDSLDYIADEAHRIP